MTTIVLLNIGGNPVRVECDGIARDTLLPKNIILAGCKELDTEARNGGALDTRAWSVPETAVVSYALGKLASKEEPASIEAEPAEAQPAPVAPPPVLTEEQKAARRARYDRVDGSVRATREARAARLAAEAAAASVAEKPANKARSRKKV